MTLVDVTLAGWVAIMWTLALIGARRRGIDLGKAAHLWVPLAAACTILAARSGGMHCGLTIGAVSVAAIVDARSGYIFDSLVAAGMLATLAADALEGSLRGLSGGALTFLLLLSLWIFTGGRGLGFGDVKLAAVIGAGFGPIDGPAAIGVAFVLGAGVSLTMVAAGRLDRKDPVQFGPYLLAGSLCDLAYQRLTTGVFA